MKKVLVVVVVVFNSFLISCNPESSSEEELKQTQNIEYADEVDQLPDEPEDD